MEAYPTRRRTEILADSLRRFIRRGARSNISKLLGKTRPEDVAAVLQGVTPAQQQQVHGTGMEENEHKTGYKKKKYGELFFFE